MECHHKGFKAANVQKTCYAQHCRVGNIPPKLVVKDQEAKWSCYPTRKIPPFPGGCGRSCNPQAPFEAPSDGSNEPWETSGDLESIQANGEVCGKWTTLGCLKEINGIGEGGRGGVWAVGSINWRDLPSKDIGEQLHRDGVLRVVQILS